MFQKICIMPKEDYLKVSDCDLPRAGKFPGKNYRQNQKGSKEFHSKGEWVMNESLKWFDHMRNHQKYDQTAIYRKAFCLYHHLIPLKIAMSEARQIIEKLESNNQPAEDSDSDSDKELESETFGENQTEDMETDGNVIEMQEVMDTDDALGSQDMFANSDDENDITRTKIDAIIEKELSKPILNLINDESNLPKCVIDSRKYKTKKAEYIETYISNEFEGLSSQEVLNQFTQTPNCVTDSDAFKKRIRNLNNSERSEKRMLKNINETLNLLKESDTHEAMVERKIITSAVYDSKFGLPKVDETRAVRQESKDLKRKLRSGESKDLLPSKRKCINYFPDTVKEIAERCWLNNCTVIEPGKHSRPKAALKDGTETIPAIYQTLSDKESYAFFEDVYKEEVTDAIKKDCTDLIDKLSKRSDSNLKTKKIEFVSKKETRFPSMGWFISQKPKETKPRSDHCTGLCKDCEGPQLNYDILRKFKKRLCFCKTKRCPNWFCRCDPEAEEECDCDPCFCDMCKKCQVKFNQSCLIV